MIHTTKFMQASRVATLAGLALIVASLAACGGGGGEDGSVATTAADATLAPNMISGVSAAAPGLTISEVGTNYYSDDVAWIEVHNASATPVSLSGYALRTGYVIPATGKSDFTPVSFALPAVDVPAHGDLVIAGKVYDSLMDSSQMVYVKNGAMVPFWNANGSVELVSNGATVDFVRFGNSRAVPVSADAWSGANVAALPAGPDQHGKSIVRLASGGLADSNTSADWTLVNFATPAGPNDVPAGVVDSDHDGIPDTAKRAGGTYAGLDLWTMGARPGRRDIFLEIDHMKGSDLGLTPRREAVQKVVDAFAEKNIALHPDTGDLYSPVFDPAAFNLGGGNAVEFAPCIELVSAGAEAAPGCTSFYAYKGANFDVRRRLAFHYAIFSNSLNADGSAGSSGVAELPGNDLIVALGGYDFSTDSESGRNMLINLQAGTLMHELGHNFGLQHGGNDDANYKPNHYSVMNYMYQFAGLSATPYSRYAAERYYLANGLKGKTYCNLVENSPCGDAFIVSYSDGRSADLDENNLSESANIGRGSSAGAYADWNNNNALTNGIFGRNINPLNGPGRSVLKDYDEWDNLQISFSRGHSGSNSGSVFSEVAPVRQSDPMSVRAHSRVLEEALPAELHAALRSLRAPYCDPNERDGWNHRGR